MSCNEPKQSVLHAFGARSEVGHLIGWLFCGAIAVTGSTGIPGNFPMGRLLGSRRALGDELDIELPRQGVP